MSRFIVCGGRDYTDRTVIEDALNKIDRGWTLVHGAALGADSIAASIWSSWGCAVAAHPADWSVGRSAGPRRNQDMAARGAELVLAFPGGRGTADMVHRAKRAGIPVHDIGRIDIERLTRD